MAIMLKKHIGNMEKFMALTLKMGGRYFNRRGELVGPLVPTQGNLARDFPFQDPSTGTTYRPDGSVTFLKFDEDDLVKETTDVVPKLSPTTDANVWD